MNYWDPNGKTWGKFELHIEEWVGAFWVLKRAKIEPPSWSAESVKKYLDGIQREEEQMMNDLAQYRIEAVGEGPNAHIARKQIMWWNNTGEMLFRNAKCIMACRLWLADGEPNRYGEPPLGRKLFVLDFVFASNSGSFIVPIGIEQSEGMYSELAEPFKFMNSQFTHDRLIGHEIRELTVAERDQLISEVFPDAQLRKTAVHSTAEPVRPTEKQKRPRWPVVNEPHNTKACDLYESYKKSSSSLQPEYADCWSVNEKKMVELGVKSGKHLRALVRARTGRLARKKLQNKQRAAKHTY